MLLTIATTFRPATGHRLDDQFEAWGESSYFTVALEGTPPLRQLLSHLYVLMPVLDNDKHYWVTEIKLAERPDYEAANRFLIKARREMPNHE